MTNIVTALATLRQMCSHAKARVVIGAMMLMSRRFVVGGWEVVNLTTDAPEVALERLKLAFDLIGHVSPNRLARINRDVGRVLLLMVDAPVYWPFVNGFAIGLAAAKEAPVDKLALTIVHEATHARLWRAGFRYTPDIRGRIEHICVRAELDFARHLPRSRELEADLREKLSLEWWTEAAMAERRRSTREALQKMSAR
jgi:hypothetical protein